MAKPGPRPEWEEEIEMILRRWPHVPEHVRKTVVELFSHYGPPAAEVSFPTPAGATWGDIEIVLISPKIAEIKVGSVVRRYTYAAIGLADQRSGKRSRGEWRMLRRYAKNTEPDAYYRLPFRRNLKIEISRFRQWLQRFFGIPGDPLRPFRAARWLPRFKIKADY